MPSQVATAQNYTTIVVGGSDGGWSGTATNLSADDTSYVVGPTITTNGHYSDHLVANQFGFSLPSSSTVVGMKVRYIRGLTGANASQIQDKSITPTLNSTALSGGSVATETTIYTILGTAPSDEYIKGGASDNWGLSLDETDINDANFGFCFQVDSHASGPATGAPALDLVEVTVYYTTTGTDPPPPPPPPPTDGVGRIDNPFRRIPESGVVTT